MASIRRRGGGIPRLSSRGNLNGGRTSAGNGVASAPVIRNTSSPAGEALSVAGRPLRRSNVPFVSDFRNGVTLQSRLNSLGANNIMRQTGELRPNGSPQMSPPIYRGSRYTFDQVPLSLRTNGGRYSQRTQSQLDANRNLQTYTPYTGNIAQSPATGGTSFQRPNYIPSRTIGDKQMAGFPEKDYTNSTDINTFMTGRPKRSGLVAPPATGRSAIQQISSQPIVQNNDILQNNIVKKKEENQYLQEIDETEALYKQIEQFENQKYNNDLTDARKYLEASLAAIDSETNSYMNTLIPQLKANKEASLEALNASMGGALYDAMGRPTNTAISYMQMYDDNYAFKLAREQKVIEDRANMQKQQLRAEITKQMNDIEAQRYDAQMKRKYDKISQINSMREQLRKEMIRQQEFEQKYGLSLMQMGSKERIAAINADARRYGYDVAAQNNLYDYNADIYDANMDYNSDIAGYNNRIELAKQTASSKDINYRVESENTYANMLQDFRVNGSFDNIVRSIMDDQRYSEQEKITILNRAAETLSAEIDDPEEGIDVSGMLNEALDRYSNDVSLGADNPYNAGDSYGVFNDIS